MGAALIRMVVALSTGRPAAAEHEDALAAIRDEAVSAQSDLLRLSEVDAAAYAAVVQARRLPRGSELERQARDVQVAHATREATMAPLETATRAGRVLALAERLAPIANPHAISDVGVAALLAASSIRGAALNVRINLPSLPGEDELRPRAETQLTELLSPLDARERAVRMTVEARLG
jgi:formiminotetrahydrofolate cyclodeaminase